jgi:uncharacterized circularly permuted ATP-grasp superfamily protein
MVHTNVAGDIFGACQGMRLAPFFQLLQAALARRASRVDPTIALLTPGPATATSSATPISPATWGCCWWKVGTCA